MRWGWALALAATAILIPREAGAVEITDDGFRIDVDSPGGSVCIAYLETFPEPRRCPGLDPVTVKGMIGAAEGAKMRPVATLSVVDGGAGYLVNITKDPQHRMDFDEEVARGFARGTRDGLRKQLGAAVPSGDDGPPTLWYANGVHLMSTEVTLDLPHQNNSLLNYAYFVGVATNDGTYCMIFNTSSQHAVGARALAKRMIDTLHATPAPKLQRPAAYWVGYFGGIAILVMGAALVLFYAARKGRPSSTNRFVMGSNCAACNRVVAMEYDADICALCGAGLHARCAQAHARAVHGAAPS